MPRDRAGAWRFEWRRSWDEVWDGQFVDGWNRIRDASSTAHVYHLPAVVRAWAETCGAAVHAEPIVGLATGPNGAQVLLPWVVQRVQGRVAARRQLGYVGDDLFGYHDPLTNTGLDRIDWAGLWRSARESISDIHDQAIFRAVDARAAPADAEPSGDLSSLLRLGGAGSFDELLESCSSSHRKDVRRQGRRLAGLGEVRVWIAAPHEADRALDDWQTFGAHAYRDVWERRNRRNRAWRDGFDELVGRVLRQGLAEGWGHYAALRVNTESIAWHVGLADRGRLYFWIPAHRYDWQSFSPGKLLLSGIIEHLIGAGWRELHFLAGEHAYKLAWRPDSCDLRAVKWHATSLRGAVLSWYDALRTA